MADRCTPSLGTQVRSSPYSGPAGEFMLKVPPETEAPAQTGQHCPASICAGPWHKRARIALLSNPKSTGNIAQLPRIREYCDSHPDVFHYEVEEASQIGEAMVSIARVRPCVLARHGIGR